MNAAALALYLRAHAHATVGDGPGTTETQMLSKEISDNLLSGCAVISDFPEQLAEVMLTTPRLVKVLAVEDELERLRQIALLIKDAAAAVQIGSPMGEC